MNRVRRVALTGGIATGKSHVRAEFERLGVPTIDSDQLARAAVAPGTAGLAAVIARFGRSVVDADGHLDRHTLAGIVFTDPQARKDLEAIIHPFVREATERFFAELDPGIHPIAIADIPLLYEVGRDRDFDVVIVAAVDPETQVQRTVHRDGVSIDEARARLAVQLPIEEKTRRADYVIDTSGSFDDTATRVRAVLSELTTR